MPNILAYVHAYVGMEHNAGAETTLHDILKNLVENGWNATVLLKPNKFSWSQNKSLDGIEEYWHEGVHVIPLTNKKQIVNYIPKADVTISHLECSQELHLNSNKWHVPTIHLVHNNHPLTVRWMQTADAMIINTEWIANEEEFKSHPAPKMVLNPPIDPSEYATTRGKSITLVNLWEDKGSAIFYELARRFPELDFLGVKGGYGVQELKDLPNVTIMEHTADMKKVFENTKIILMPSKYESFGRVGVEAMASGIPTIAHPTNGLLESLGNSGTFADRDDADAWETALRDLLKPAKYGKASKLALARSKALEEQRERQLDLMRFFIPEVIGRKGKAN